MKLNRLSTLRSTPRAASEQKRERLGVS